MKQLFTLSVLIYMSIFISCGEIIDSCAYDIGDIVEVTISLKPNTTYDLDHIQIKNTCGEDVSIQLISSQYYEAATYSRTRTFDIKITEVISEYSYIGFVIIK